MDAKLIDAACKRIMQPGRDFKWGIDDCCTWACDVVLEATGLDLMASLRGYQSEIDANVLKVEAGGFVALVMQLAKDNNLGHEPFPFTRADIGIVTTPEGPVLALFTEGRWVARGKNGPIILRRASGAVAWRLP